MVAMPADLHGEVFPDHGTTARQYGFVVSHAGHAVGRANNRSWRPEISDDGIAWVLGERDEETGTATDTALVAVGCALTVARLVMRRYGHTESVRLAPETTRPGAIAQIAFGEDHAPSLDDHLRFNALVATAARCRINETRPLPMGLLRALPHLVTRPGMWASVVATSSDRMRARDCLRQSDETRLIHDELVGPLDMAAPGMFLLGTPDCTPANWVVLGEALQEIVVHLRLQEAQVRILGMGSVLGAQIQNALALAAPPQLLVCAAYCAPRT
jgi:hypothetical protein